MKKNINIEYKKLAVIGISGALMLSMMSLNASADAKSKKNELNTFIPSAGIAKAMVESQEDNSEEETSLNGGIATVLANYYTNTDKNSLSVQAVDKVLRLLPNQNTTDVAAVTAAVPEPAQQQEAAPLTSVVPGYTVLGVANVTNYLNVRETPDQGGKLLGKLPMNAGCEILESLDGWYKVKSGNVEGYVSSEFLLTGENANQRAREAMMTLANVQADKLMVREQPNKDCGILTRVAQGEELEVVEVLDGWVKVNIDSQQGYVAAEYVTVHQALPTGVTLQEISTGSGVSNTAVDLIEYAKQFLGNRYVYGGTSLTKGTDCSGFTMRIFEHFGYSLSRTSGAQSGNGTKVSLSEIQPGDLLFYSRGGSIGHVAIYIGNGQIIHASTEKTGIIISNAFYATPACATRIIK